MPQQLFRLVPVEDGAGGDAGAFADSGAEAEDPLEGLSIKYRVKYTYT